MPPSETTLIRFYCSDNTMEFENPAVISVRVITGMSSGFKVTWSVKF